MILVNAINILVMRILFGFSYPVAFGLGKPVGYGGRMLVKIVDKSGLGSVSPKEKPDQLKQKRAGQFDYLPL
jgi:hypothetical protein